MHRLMGRKTRKGEKIFIQIWTVRAPYSAQLNRAPRSWACGLERQLTMPENHGIQAGQCWKIIDQIIVKGDEAKADVLFRYVMGNGRAG
jgi:hypothetical protein